MRILPSYNLCTWRCRETGEQTICCRPTVYTLSRRILFSVLCAGAAWFFHWTLGATDLRTLVSQGFDLAQAGSLLAPPWSLDEVLMLIHAGILGMLLVAALLAPLSCLWNHVTLSRSRDDELVVRSFLLLPRTARWPLSAGGSICTLVMERYGFNRHGRLTEHYWEWIVELSLGATPVPSLPAGPGLIFGEIGPRFQVYRERQQPALVGRAPEPVRILVKGLRSLTGFKAHPPQLLEGQRVGRRRIAYRRSFQHVEEEPVIHRSGQLGPGEQLPEEIRARMAEFRDRPSGVLPDGIPFTASQTIVVTDESGQQRVYHSVDELPEEVRRRLGL